MNTNTNSQSFEKINKGTVTYLYKPFDYDTENLKKKLFMFIHNCQPGSVISFGSFGVYADNNPICGIATNTKNQDVTLKDKAITNYVFIQVSHNTKNKHYSDTIKYCLEDMFSSLSEITPQLANQIHETLATGTTLKQSYINWNYNALKIKEQANILPSLTKPYFLKESFKILESKEESKLKPFLAILSGMRFNSIEKKEREDLICNAVDSGQSLIQHIGSELIMFESEGLELKEMQKLIASKSGEINKSISTNPSSILNMLLNQTCYSAKSHKAVTHKSCMTDDDMFKTISLIDLWQGHNIRIVKFKTTNNREFGFDLFSAEISFSMMVLEEDPEIKRLIKETLVSAYLNNNSKIYEIIGTQFVNSKDQSWNRNPFNKENEPEIQASLITFLVLAMSELDEVNQDTYEKTRNIILKVQNDHVSPSFDDLLSQLNDMDELKDVTKGITNFTTQDNSKEDNNAKTVFPFNLNNNNKKNLKISLILQLMNACYEISNSTDFSRRKLMIVSEIDSIIDKEFSTAKLFEFICRILKRYGASLIVLDERLLSNRNPVSSVLYSCGSHNLINTNLINKDDLSEECEYTFSHDLIKLEKALNCNQSLLRQGHLLTSDSELSVVKFR